MNQQQRDIDKLFAQIRANSTPPALETLVQTQPSGAIVAVKKGTSLFSGKVLSNFFWKVLALGSVGIVGAVLYFSAFSSVSDSNKTTPSQATNSQAVATNTPQAEATQRTEKKENSEQYSIVPHGTSKGMVTPEHSNGAPTTSALSAARGRQNHDTHHTSTQTTNADNRLSASQRTAKKLSKQPVKRNVLSRSEAATENAMAEHPALTRDALGKVQNSPLLGSAMNVPFPTSLPTPQEEFPMQWSTDNSSYTTTVLFDGFSLLSDIVQLGGEFRLGNNTSYGVLVGVGNIQGDVRDTSYALVVAGAQFSYYVLGDFTQGLHVGAQAVFSSMDSRAQHSLYERGSTLSFAPYAGYKLLLLKGLTLNAQAGIGAVSPSLSSGTEQTTEQLSQTKQQWHIAPRVHVGIGWSF